MSIEKQIRQAISDGLASQIPAIDKVSGQRINRLDLRERERAAKAVAESLPPRLLEQIRQDYERALIETLYCLVPADCKYEIRVTELPRELATGHRTVKELDDELYERVLQRGERKYIDRQLERLESD